MTQFPNNDEKLVTFLREHCPLPPPARADAEEQLMGLVEKQSILSQKSRQAFFWLVPSAIAACILLAWGSCRWLNPPPQIATNSDELEAFLVNNWEGVMGETSWTSQTESPEADSLLMTAPEKTSPPSKP